MFNSDLYVLTRKEKKMLAKVETTVEEAWKILERNYNLLEGLYCDVCVSYEIGCPHCNCGHKCNGYLVNEISTLNIPVCKWKAISMYYKTYKKTYWCIHQTFGGINLNDVANMITYNNDSEHIDELPDNDEGFVKCERFLLGHMEWAMRIIRNDKD